MAKIDIGYLEIVRLDRRYRQRIDAIEDILTSFGETGDELLERVSNTMLQLGATAYKDYGPESIVNVRSLFLDKALEKLTESEDATCIFPLRNFLDQLQFFLVSRPS